MKRLWSPWRMKYIQNYTRGSACVFCAAVNQENDAENLVVFRGSNAFVILNRYPYTSGHLMIVPFSHSPDIQCLTDSARAEIMYLSNFAIKALDRVYHPQGYNMGMNIGEPAGAGIAGHVHMHIVPRWAGDTNFITTVGSIRVLPEGLSDTYKRIQLAWSEIAINS